MRVLLTIVFAAALASDLLAEDIVPPFVPGYDRFHHEDQKFGGLSGALLTSELSCTACHQTYGFGDFKLPLAPKGGPNLLGIADRVDADWIAKYLTSPSKEKPGTTMPEMFSGLDETTTREQVRALTAFLGTLHRDFPEVQGSGRVPVPHRFWDRGREEVGRELYHQVGCVACHAPDAEYEPPESKPSPLDQMLADLDPEEIEELGLGNAARRVNSVPHPKFEEKYTRKSLTFLLLDPETVRPSGRMPDLKLSPVEAADIAAYLLREQKGTTAEPSTFETDAELIATGKRLFIEKNCMNCHSLPKMKPRRKLSGIRFSARKGVSDCTKPGSRTGPYFPVTREQRQWLIDWVDNSAETELRLAKQEDGDWLPTDYRMRTLNCYACHERDDRGGVGRYRRPYFETIGQVDLGDEGRLPPPLDFVGFKMKPKWMHQVLAGKGAIRPHMTIRMPKYPAHTTKELPKLFSLTDEIHRIYGEKRKTESEVFGDPLPSADAGRALMDLGCVQCHQFKGETLPGVVGVELSGVTGRVHPEWFRDFLKDPGSLKNRTRMPTFFPKGKSQAPHILDGDVDAQIAAIWHYLKTIDRQPLPEKIREARAKNYELMPTDKPILLRTFMPEAGTHAIAVGFPQRVHFAFDAKSSRLAEVWRGRFLDAQGTWFIRFAPPASPLGTERKPLPDGPAFVVGASPPRTWPSNPTGKFLGYRLDNSGTPTFRYRVGNIEITDRIAPDGENGLRRDLRFQAVTEEEPNRLWFRIVQGKRTLSIAETEKFIRVVAPGQPEVQLPLGTPVRENLESLTNEPLIPAVMPIELPKTRTHTLTIRYRW